MYVKLKNENEKHKQPSQVAKKQRKNGWEMRAFRQQRKGVLKSKTLWRFNPKKANKITFKRLYKMSKNDCCLP